MHYVVGDVHGCFDEMILLLQKIENIDRRARFIFVGDFLDRGPKVMDTIEWAMLHITKDGKYQSVLGNHEDMVIRWFYEYRKWDENPSRKMHWMPKTQYGFENMLAEKGYTTLEQIECIVAFLESLPMEIQIPLKDIDGYEITYRIVHSWIGDSKSNEDEKRFQMLWNRELVDHNRLNEVIVHGHTPTLALEKRPGKIAYYKNAINVDGGCCFQNQYPGKQGALCALCLETWQEFYVPAL